MPCPRRCSPRGGVFAKRALARRRELVQLHRRGFVDDEKRGSDWERRERTHRQRLEREYLVLSRALRNYLERLLAEFEGEFLTPLTLKIYKQISEAGVRSQNYAVCRCGRAFKVTRSNRTTCTEECRKLRPKKPTAGTEPYELGTWESGENTRKGFLVRFGGAARFGSESREVEFGIHCPGCGSFAWLRPGQRYCPACRDDAARQRRRRARRAA